MDTSYTWTVKLLWSVDTEHVLYASQSQGELGSKEAWKKQKLRARRAEVVLKYAHGARNECVQGTSLDTRTAHAANASESMRRSSGGRTTTRCRNQKDLERWSICHLEFVAKVLDVEGVQESAEEQPSKEGLSQRFQNRMRNSLKKVSPKRVHQKQCTRTCMTACMMEWSQVRQTRQKRVPKGHPRCSERMPTTRTLLWSSSECRQKFHPANDSR